MLEGERHAERIVELGDQFSVQVDRALMEEENKPLLRDAYIEVLDDYFTAEAKNGIKQAIADEAIKLCAEHYNDHWRNRKMWWPTDDEGKPDCQLFIIILLTIIMVIVYVQPFNNSWVSKRGKPITPL